MNIAFKSIKVPRYQQLIHTGQVVNMDVEIIGVNDGYSQLTDASLVSLTLYNPLGVKLMTESPLERIDLGIFRTFYQTRPSSVKGVYTGTFSARLGDVYARLDKVAVFKVVKNSSFETFTYLAINDQLGTTWYWWIDDSESLVANPEIPDFINLLAAPISGNPYWIEIGGKFIYPQLDGTPDVVLSQPAVGTGVNSSPVFIGTNITDYGLTVNQANEIEVISV